MGLMPLLHLSSSRQDIPTKTIHLDPVKCALVELHRPACFLALPYQSNIVHELTSYEHLTITNDPCYLVHHCLRVITPEQVGVASSQAAQASKDETRRGSFNQDHRAGLKEAILKSN